MKSTIRISALLWADILVGYALFVMQDYLTDVWGLSFTHAAAILNIWNGASLLLQPAFLVVVDTLLGHFVMLMISSFAYTVGILFVLLSAPPVLANSTGTCKQYEQECIGHTQKALFYTGMALIAVGVAGNKVSVKPFLEQQPDKPDGNEVIGCLKIPSMIMVALVGVAGAIALPYIKPWTFRFGIPAVCTAIATLSFLTGLCCYTYKIKGPEREHVSYIGRMFSLRMLTMWMTFIVCGMVSSVGNTYFVQQASNLNRNIGKWKVPTQVLLFAQTWLGKFLAAVAANYFVKGPAKRVVVAKTFAVLCCITAARMEIKRLNIVRSHGLVDSPDAAIPMSVYWLLFQFVLLGGLDSLLEKSVAEFHEREAPDERERQWLEVFTKGVSGLGYMCSVFFVSVMGKKSAEGGEPGWFEFTLNRSRLDRYYWALAILTSGSLVVFVVVRLCCRCRNR